MITQFHGVDGFVTQWFSVWETDRAKGRAKCFAHIAAVIRLMEYVDDHKPNYGQLTDDELEERIKEIQSFIDSSHRNGIHAFHEHHPTCSCFEDCYFWLIAVRVVIFKGGLLPNLAIH